MDKFDGRVYRKGRKVEIEVIASGEIIGQYIVQNVTPKEIVLNSTDGDKETLFSIEDFIPRYGYEYYQLNCV